MSIGNVNVYGGWEKRLVVEFQELSEKIAKLEKFLEENRVTEEISEFDLKSIVLLKQQLVFMKEYHNILLKRLEHHNIIV